jgi:hypothetical protein
MYAEAVKLYESCLQGAFAGDGKILFGLARAAVENREWQKAIQTLTRLKTSSPKMRPLDARLLEIRAMEGAGDNDAALAAYRELIPRFVGLEARYRYGVLLTRLGHNEAALLAFNEVIKHSVRFSSTIEGEQQWADAARQAIAG